MLTKARKAITLSLAILAGGFIQSANADYSELSGTNAATTRQDIVVSLKSNPMANLEEACLAVTFARMLSRPSPSGNVAHNVTLFVTLDGVALAADSNRASKRMCTTPWEGELSLKDNLETFLDFDGANNANDMVVCPLCWQERYPGELPKYGVLPGKEGTPGDAIGTMIGNADKILDF